MKIKSKNTLEFFRYSAVLIPRLFLAAHHRDKSAMHSNLIYSNRPGFHDLDNTIGSFAGMLNLIGLISFDQMKLQPVPLKANAPRRC